MPVVEDTAMLVIVLVLNIAILAGLKIAVLQISFGFVSAVIAINLPEAMLFPWLHLLLILVCIFQIANATIGMRKKT